ncbi:MAG TPA: metal-dependent hydrolase [Longimicrobiales bacterium]
MPTPVGHSLAGLAVHLASPGQPVRSRAVQALALVVLANLADVDFIPGYVVGEPRAYHWGPTHSLAAALLAGGIAGWIARRFTGRFLPMALLGTVAYGSHVVMDLLLGPGTRYLSMGLQVWWPFSTAPHMAPWSVFRMFPASIHELGPVGALFSRSVLPLIAREVAILIPVCAAAWAGRRIYRRVTGSDGADDGSALTPATGEAAGHVMSRNTSPGRHAG